MNSYCKVFYPKSKVVNENCAILAGHNCSIESDCQYVILVGLHDVTIRDKSHVFIDDTGEHPITEEEYHRIIKAVRLSLRVYGLA